MNLARCHLCRRLILDAIGWLTGRRPLCSCCAEIIDLRRGPGGEA